MNDTLKLVNKICRMLDGLTVHDARMILGMCAQVNEMRGQSAAEAIARGLLENDGGQLQ